MRAEKIYALVDKMASGIRVHLAGGLVYTIKYRGSECKMWLYHILWGEAMARFRDYIKHKESMNLADSKGAGGKCIESK